MRRCYSSFWTNGLIHLCHKTNQNPWICHKFSSCLLPPETPAWLTSHHLLCYFQVQVSITSHLGYCNSLPLTSLLLWLFSINLHTETRGIFENISFLCHLHPTTFKSLLWFSPALRIKPKPLSLCPSPYASTFPAPSLCHSVSYMLYSRHANL